MGNEDLIEEAIKAFEDYNDIKIDNYISDEFDGGGLEKISDNYIGKDIFYNNIQDWVSFFDEKDRHIFLKLLKNYRYYPEGKVRKCIKLIIKDIEDDNTCGLNEIYFITFPSKEGIKSGGDDLRSILQVVNFGKIKKDNIIADTDKNIETIICKAKGIVFLDDVVGSGTTLYGNVKKCIIDLKLQDHKNIKLYVAILFGREKKIKEKIKQLEKLGVKIKIILIEKGKKCFDESEIFSKDESENYKKIVEDYELKIKDNSEDESKDYVLGFEKNQFLVSFKYNTPNNTLSNFWKPSNISVPLFIRTSYIRPDIDAIKKTKENNQMNAYILAKLRQEDAESK